MDLTREGDVAIRKMTSAAADRFRLVGRGRLRAGAPADLVDFNLAILAGRQRDLYARNSGGEE